MRDEERLAALLDAWQEAHSRGEDIPPEELCRDCTALLPECTRRIEVLRRFDALRGAPDGDPVSPYSFFSPPPFDAAAEDESPLPQAGEDFGDYRIAALLGEGGMGCVYRAADRVLHREVALKVMRPKMAARAEARAYFLHEARAMAALHHDHVVPIYQVGEVNGIPFLT